MKPQSDYKQKKRTLLKMRIWELALYAIIIALVLITVIVFIVSELK